jgi:hypothetical protein
VTALVRIAYILLCHRDPEGIVAQAERLTAAGDCVAIHFDARARDHDFRRVRAALAANPSVAFTPRRHACGWGEWSLIEATLEGMRTALQAFPGASHVYLLSGDCMPIKSAEQARSMLDRSAADHIECVDFFTSGWIRTGLRDERLIYRHPFNERRQTRLFYASLDLQRRLGLRRALPAGLQIRIGSQWWCLRRPTAEAILAFCRDRPDVLRFFRSTWIPDETFFQSLVRHLVPVAEIRSRPPTFLMFTDYGVPVTFHNDHHDLLLSQDHLFARKISPDARDLKARLGALYAAAGATVAVSGEGRKVHRYLTGRGRVGQRFAPRFWERATTLGPGRTLLILCCKKWHVGKRLADRIAAVTGIPVLHYLFDETATALPDLGGIETTLDKRSRHRRALLAQICDRWQSDTLLICLDSAGREAIADLRGDRATTRVLEVDCAFTDADLAGHSRRVGLADEATPVSTLDRLLPALRCDLTGEGDRLRGAGPGIYRLRETASARENAVPLAAFLAIPEDKAFEIAATDALFTD